MNRFGIFLAALGLALVSVAPARGASKSEKPEKPAEPEAQSESGDFLQNFKVRNLGPTVGGGRVSSVAGIPGDPNVYYVGAAGGGVFKTVRRRPFLEGDLRKRS